MNKALVTGANGFIGRHLCKHLAKNGLDVAGIGYGDWAKEEYSKWGLTAWHSSEVDAVNLQDNYDKVGPPDGIYHAAGGASVGAAIENPRRDYLNTVATTSQLLDWMRQHAPSAKLITLSSAAVYGSNHKNSISEGDTKIPFSPYGYHKRMMELLCQSYSDTYGIKIVIARLFSVYGRELKKQLMWDICSKLSKGVAPLTLAGSGDELRDWTNVNDVVRALHLIATKTDEKIKILNIGTGVGTSVKSIAGEISSAWFESDKEQKIVTKFTGVSRSGDPFSLIARSSELDQLGFKWEVPLNDGIKEYVNWFRAAAEDKK